MKLKSLHIKAPKSPGAGRLSRGAADRRLGSERPDTLGSYHEAIIKVVAYVIRQNELLVFLHADDDNFDQSEP